MSDTRVFVSASAAAGSCLASFVVFHPTVRAAASVPGLAGLGCVWAMFSTFPHLSETVDFGRRSINAACLSAFLAAVCVTVPYEFRYPLMILSFPIPLFYATCELACRTPLERLIFTPSALLLHYAVLGFGPEDRGAAWLFCAEFVLFFSLGSICAVVAHLFCTVLLRRRESFCVCSVDNALCACLDSLMYVVEGVEAYFATGHTHRAELQGRLAALREAIASYEACVKLWQMEWWSDKPPATALKQLQTELVATCDLQAALLETFEDGYSSRWRSLQWDAVSVELEDIRQCTIAALRVVCRSARGGKEAPNLQDHTVTDEVEAAVQSAQRFKEAIYGHRAWLNKDDAAKTSNKALTAKEYCRAEYAQLAFRQSACSIADLHKALAAADIGQRARRTTPPTHVLRNLWDSVRKYFSTELFSPAAFFKAKPADTILDGGVTQPLRRRARRLMKYPLRLCVTCHLAAIMLKELERFLPYGFWALLPCILCFLPTTGAVVQKSMRRVAGTMLGGVASLVCIYWSSYNPPALLTQLCVVTFVGKYASLTGSIGYAGLTFALTWHIVVLGSWDSDASESTEGLAIAAWRVGMTTFGSMIAVICSLMLFPNHATVMFEHLCAETILCTTEVCVIMGEGTMRTHALGEATHHLDEQGFQTTDVADLEAFCRSSGTERLALMKEGDAEAWLVPRFCPCLELLQTSANNLAQAAAAFRCNGSRDGLILATEVVVQRWLAIAEKHGSTVQHHCARLQETLRQATLSLALRLRGVRAPRAKTHTVKLRRTLQAFQSSFELARQQVLASGQMHDLCVRGLDTFYATIYNITKYVETWLLLERELDKYCVKPLTDVDGGSDQASSPTSEDGTSFGLVTPMVTPNASSGLVLDADPAMENTHAQPLEQDVEKGINALSLAKGEREVSNVSDKLGKPSWAMRPEDTDTGSVCDQRLVVPSERNEISL
eukprot:TRINITY_DN27451_c0_g1_i1.p1 TRINITY_DN27451_c0_g1~~TRINITY_DN27451_c0_g1_i1.p1  ORF type:complete len:952 (-),score=190.23 TRINITY_DN27451_c0_g1_i1:137-2992(-)